MQLNNKKILLTGGCGFIGNNLTRLLMQEEVSDLLIIDKMTYVSNNYFHQKNNIKVLEQDICSERSYQMVLEYKPDILINMAAESHVDVSIKDPNIFLNSNVYGTVNLMNACLKLKKMPLFVQISTDEVTGDVQFNSSIESSPRKTSSPYSASKAAAEHFVEAYGRTYKLPYTITRCGNNYGPFQYPEKFIPKAITNILSEKKIPIYGNGLNQRDWIYVDDHCRGILEVINIWQPFYTIGQDIFNIGYGNPISNIKIIEELCNLMNKDFNDVIEFVPDRAGHDFRYSIDSSYLQSLSSWKPEISLEEGLKYTIEWYKYHKDIF